MYKKIIFNLVYCKRCIIDYNFWASKSDDVPVNECPFCVHQIKFPIQTFPSLFDGRRVGQHTDGTLHLGEVTTRHNCGWLIIDSDLLKKLSEVDNTFAKIMGSKEIMFILNIKKVTTGQIQILRKHRKKTCFSLVDDD